MVKKIIAIILFLSLFIPGKSAYALTFDEHSAHWIIVVQSGGIDYTQDTLDNHSTSNNIYGYDWSNCSGATRYHTDSTDVPYYCVEEYPFNFGGPIIINSAYFYGYNYYGNIGFNYSPPHYVYATALLPASIDAIVSQMTWFNKKTGSTWQSPGMGDDIDTVNYFVQYNPGGPANYYTINITGAGLTNLQNYINGGFKNIVWWFPK